MIKHSEKVEISDIKKSYWNAIDANVMLQDENKDLKAKIFRLEKVINKLLERISKLEMEIEEYESNNIQRKTKWNYWGNEKRFRKWKRYG